MAHASANLFRCVRARCGLVKRDGDMDADGDMDWNGAGYGLGKGWGSGRRRRRWQSSAHKLEVCDHAADAPGLSNPGGPIQHT